MKKTVFVVDVVWTGHIPSFHKMIVKGFLELGNSVISLSPNPKSVEQYIEIENSTYSTNLKCLFLSEEKLKKNLKHRFYESFLHRSVFLKKGFDTCQSKALWLHAREIIGNNRGSERVFVFFPYIDYGFQNQNISASWIEKNFPFDWSVLKIIIKNLEKQNSEIYISCKKLPVYIHIR